MRALYWLAVVALCASVGCGSCGKKADKKDRGQAAKEEGPYVLPLDAPLGLWMKVSEGKNFRPAPERNKVPETKKLSENEADAVLARLSKLETDAQDTKAFALREGSLPPPRPGNTIASSFPPALGATPAAEGDGAALEIARFAPEGEVDLAPYLSVTFNQPMVAVSSHADSIKNLPVILKPQPPGAWRWIGTKTLLFDPDIRFPQATEYQVEVKQGATSTSGKVLSTAKTFSFTTPAPRLKPSYPPYGTPQQPDGLMVVAFDQHIDSAAVLAKLEVRAKGQSFKVRTATAAEIERDKEATRFIEGLENAEQGGRYLVVRPLERLPLDSDCSVTVERETPSAEGPLTTKEEQSFTFRTYGPFEIERTRCGYECRPGTTWSFNLSNPIDLDTLKSEDVVVTPKVDGLRVDTSGSRITVSSDSHANTKYTVSLPSKLKDEFGQVLGKNEASFSVGEAEPRLWGAGGLVVLDPAAKKPTLDVFSVNHKKLRVRIQKVSITDWGAYQGYKEGVWRSEKPTKPPGTNVFNKQIEIVEDEDSQFVETAIDLAPALDENLGHALVIIETIRPPGARDWHSTIQTAWVQVTHIGLDVQSDGKGTVAFATNLADGKPLEGVSLAFSSRGAGINSDTRGMASFSRSAVEEGSLLVGKKGKDTAFMDPVNGLYGQWGPYRRERTSGWFVYNDRGMYRPGETVHLKGWLRNIGSDSDSDVEMSEAKEFSYVVTGPRGNEITKGTGAVNSLGGFDTKFELPTTPNLGRASVVFSASGAPRFRHQFQIEEFRRPEFEVSVEASPGPHMIGSQSSLRAEAKYLAGGVLPSSEVNWFVQAEPGSFTPPNQDDFTFGTWVPWWQSRADGDADAGNAEERFAAKTNASGEHTIDIDFLSVKPPGPMRVVAQASVTDVNRQTWSSSATMLVHPADLYVGLKRERYFVERGTPMKVESLVVDLDGKAALGTEVTIKAALMQWTYESGTWTQNEQKAEECKIVSTAESQECSFASEVGGQYQITASIVDARGRPNQSQLTMWVAGGKSPASREVQQEVVTLIPDKKQYRPGETARILVQSPFAPAEGIVSLRRSGLVSTERITMAEGGTTIEVPILDGHTPNVIVQVDLVGAAARLDDRGQPAPSLPKRPAYAAGEINLSVPPDHRALQVQVTPAADQLEPGEETTLDLLVQDATNAPVAGAELSVVVVDESVLSLSNYKTPEPLPAFYPTREEGVADHHSRRYLKLARADASAFGFGTAGEGPGGGGTGWGTIGTGSYGTIGHGSGTGSGYGSGAGKGKAQAEGRMGKKESTRATGQFAMKSNVADPQLARSMAVNQARRAGVHVVGDEAPATAIEVRSDFNALAVFAPEVRTDASGHATVSVKLPDNLTRYRVMVAAAAGARQFGHGESAITARKTMMVRPSPPRFLNFGDEFKLPVVLQNQSDAPMTVKVAVRAENAKLTEGSGRQVVVPANDRVEVLFPARSKMPGTARFQVGASAGKWSDANEFSFPVWTPATTEGFATYGEVDSGSLRQTVAMPSGVIKEFGELQITTSSTQLQALTDAILYLVAYKFECSEQLSSRVVAVAALRDVLTAFEAEGLPAPKEIEAAVRRDLKKLEGRQKYDGSFGFWSRNDDAGPYTSIHVAHAIARAKKKGFTIPGSMVSRSMEYLQSIERHIPAIYSQKTKQTLIAYSLFVRSLFDDKDTAKARRLFRDAGIENLSTDALGWLLYTMSSDAASSKELAAIHKHLSSKIAETASTATFATSVSDGDHVIFHSSRRTDGILLEALIEDKPDSDLIPKITRGLLAHRERGHWGNTQDNAFVLLALDRYFNTYEKSVPKFVARAWLGDAYAGEHAFAGRTTERHQINVPLSYLAEGSKERDVLLQKDGEGRMYYRIGMNYALEDLRLEAADHGFAVQRQYESVDDKDDVVQLADGSWKFKAGAKVRVRLTMVATSRRYQVALVDPLPGGLEPMNPALAVTGAIPSDQNQQNSGNRYWWWSMPWFEHQNMRDERVEAFTSILWAGVHEYTYVGRATTPGTYTVPPTKAEEMYTPETFGRSATDKVTIQ